MSSNNSISYDMALGFYRDLLGVTHTSGSSGIMPTRMIAEYLGISDDKAEAYLWACARYGITERQGGAWVV